MFCFREKEKRRWLFFISKVSASLTQKDGFWNVSSVRMNHEWRENIIEYVC